MSSNNNDPLDLSGIKAALLDTKETAAATEEEKTAHERIVDALRDNLESLGVEQPKLSDPLESLTLKVRKRVEFLREIQKQHDELEAKFFEEKAALEDKYQKLYEPLYTKRYQIVNGVVEVEGVKNEDVESTPAEDKASEDKGVPNFWLTAMKTNEMLAEEIQERDEGALKYLKDIKWFRTDNPKGFKLEFFFDTNPYFKNSVLIKIYHMLDGEEPILEKVTGTEIEWYPGKCLTQKLMRKKPRKGSKSTKPITKTEHCESFFNFFKPPQVPDDDDEIDDDIAELLEDQMEQDYDIGSTIRDKIIPHAVSWFTGEAAKEDDYAIVEDDEDECGDEDGDDEDEDEDEDDEEDEEEDSKVVEKGEKKNRGAKGGEGQ